MFGFFFIRTGDFAFRTGHWPTLSVLKDFFPRHVTRGIDLAPSAYEADLFQRTHRRRSAATLDAAEKVFKTL